MVPTCNVDNNNGEWMSEVLQCLLWKNMLFCHLPWKKKNLKYKNGPTWWKTFLFNDANYMPWFWKSLDLNEDYSLAPGIPTTAK